MAVRTWGLVGGKITNIANIDKASCSEVTCLECGQPLIPNQGSKYDWHFKHKAECECKGGSAETLIHKLAKSVLQDASKFYVPAVYLQFREPTSIRDGFLGAVINVEIEKTVEITEEIKGVVKKTQLRPDATLTLADGSTIYVEIYVNHKVTADKRKKYSKLRNRFTVVEVDLRKYTKTYDSNDFNITSFTEDITGESDCKFTVATNNLADYEAILEDATFTFSNRSYVACPAKDFTEIMDSTNCRKLCPFYANKVGKLHTCYGRGCFAFAKEVINSVQKVHKDDEVGVNKYTKEDRLDIHSIDMPKPVSKVEYGNAKHYFGTCPRCGNALRLALGNGAVPFDEEYLKTKGNVEPFRVTVDFGKFQKPQRLVKGMAVHYQYCSECEHKQLIPCPACASKGLTRFMHVKMMKAEHGTKIFLGCQGYHTEQDKSDKLQCNETLTLWDSNPVSNKNIADELRAVESIDFYVANYKKARKLIEAVKAKAKGGKR